MAYQPHIPICVSSRVIERADSVSQAEVERIKGESGTHLSCQRREQVKQESKRTRKGKNTHLFSQRHDKSLQVEKEVKAHMQKHSYMYPYLKRHVPNRKSQESRSDHFRETALVLSSNPYNEH